MKSEFTNKISIAHPDLTCKGSMFYDAMARATEEFRDEIADVYFGTFYEYEYNGEKKSYGNAMNVGIGHRSEEFDYLMKVQEEFGVSISLTVNPTVHPKEMMFDKKVIDDFLDWLQFYYDAGIRICTISNVTLMRRGVLQKRFPEMKWKNTVNHKVKTAQEYINYVHIGYDHIQIDRSLTRDLTELTKIKKERDRLGKPIYMLIHEDCMPECPMWNDHTDVLSNNQTYNVSDACGRWSYNTYKLPRINLDSYWVSKETFMMFSELVDVFKYSGRFQSITETSKYEWHFGDRSTFAAEDDKLDLRCDSFEHAVSVGYVSWWLPLAENRGEVIPKEEKNIEIVPIEGLPAELNLNQDFFKGVFDIIDQSLEAESDKLTINDIPVGVWDTKQGHALEKKLTNCRSQCYNCHLCEITFGLDHIDSIIQLSKKDMIKGEEIIRVKLGDIRENYKMKDVKPKSTKV